MKTGLKILKAQNTLCSSLSASLCWKRWICPASRAVQQPQRKPRPTTTCRGEQPHPTTLCRGEQPHRSHTCPHAKAASAWVEHGLPQYLTRVLEGEEPAGTSPPPCPQHGRAFLGCQPGGLSTACRAGEQRKTGCFASSSKGQGVLI